MAGLVMTPNRSNHLAILQWSQDHVQEPRIRLGLIHPWFLADPANVYLVTLTIWCRPLMWILWLPILKTLPYHFPVHSAHSKRESTSCPLRTSHPQAKRPSRQR